MDNFEFNYSFPNKTSIPNTLILVMKGINTGSIKRMTIKMKRPITSPLNGRFNEGTNNPAIKYATRIAADVHETNRVVLRNSIAGVAVYLFSKRC
jgi:hypothetical protein